MKTFQFLFQGINFKEYFLHKSQYEIYDYFSESHFRGKHPCRCFDKEYICHLQFGQFATSALIVSRYTRLKHYLLLQINKHFHFHIFINHFHFFKHADATIESDLLELHYRSRADAHKLPTYLFQGHLAPWEIIFTHNIMSFGLSINNIMISKFKLYMEITDNRLFDKHVVCPFLATIQKKIGCGFAPYLTPFQVGDRIKRNGIPMMSFRIYVHKYQILVLKTPYVKAYLNIFDGPTLNFQQRYGEKIIMSSFQATIVASELKLLYRQGSGGLKYFGRYLKPTQISLNELSLSLALNVSENDFRESNTFYNQKAMKVPSERYLQITLASLSYYGPNEYSEMCQYGGIAVYLKEGKKINSRQNYLEALSACRNISNSDTDIQNGSSPIYKILTTRHTTSVIMVMYGYSSYSEIYITINISESSCFGIYIKMLPCKGITEIYINLEYYKNIRVHKESNRGFHYIVCRNRYTISFDMGLKECASFIISQKNTSPLHGQSMTYVSLYYLDKDKVFEVNKSSIRVWNVEAYGANTVMTSHPEHQIDFNNILFYEGILKQTEPFFWFDTYTEYCSSPKLSMCRRGMLGVNSYYTEGGRFSLSLEDHKYSQDFSGPLFTKVTKVTKQWFNYTLLQYPIIWFLEDRLYLYHLHTTVPQGWTVITVFFTCTDLNSWKSHMSNNSVVQNFLLQQNCNNMSFSLRQKDFTMYGYTLYTGVSRHYQNKLAIQMQPIFCRYMKKGGHTCNRHYINVTFYSNLSLLPETIGQFIMTNIEATNHSGGTKYTFSANISKSQNIYIYAPPICQLSSVMTGNSSITSIITLTFNDQLKMDYKIGYDTFFRPKYYMNEIDLTLKNPFCFKKSHCNHSEFVSWNEANEQCERLGLALPSVHKGYDQTVLFYKSDDGLQRLFYDKVGIYIGLHLDVCIFIGLPKKYILYFYIINEIWRHLE